MTCWIPAFAGMTTKLNNLALLFSILVVSSLGAVPPPAELPPSEQPPCKLNSHATLQRLKTLRRYAPGAAPPISATTYKVAVIRIDFSDKNMSVSTAPTQTQFSNVRSFYAENSYDLLTVTATISTGGSGKYGAYRMPQTHSYYANGLASRYSEIFSDAVNIATAAGFNFSTMDHIMVYHAGEGSETVSSSERSSFIWSGFAPTVASGITLNGKTFSGAVFVPEKETASYDPLGVIVHEYGHQLGLPDLYNTSTSLPTAGKWSLMDGGTYTGPSPTLSLGSNPAHLDAWSKLFLGFSSPQTVTTSPVPETSLTQAESSRSGFIRLPIPVSDVGSSNEYFLVEYRRTEGGSFDNYLPGQGLLIWHVDDSIASNSTRLNANNVNNNSSRLGVDLIEADGTEASNNGDSGDPWPGSSEQTRFKTPRSNAYNGQDSGVILLNFAGVGNSAMTFRVLSTLNNPAINNNTEIGKVVVTGGVNGYVNPADGESSLFGIRPSTNGTVQIKVYTFTGDLVWETSFAGTARQQQTVRWTAENSGGSTVSSGTYLLHVFGGGLDTKAKIVIVR